MINRLIPANLVWLLFAAFSPLGAGNPLAGYAESPTRGSDADIEKLLKQGCEALDKGEISDALTSLENCVDIAPNDARSHYWLGRSHFANANSLLAQGSDSGFFISATFSDAAACFESAIELAPEWAEARGYLAQALYASGSDPETVLEVGEAALSLGDHSVATVTTMVDILLSQRQARIDSEDEDGAKILTDRAVQIIESATDTLLKRAAEERMAKAAASEASDPEATDPENLGTEEAASDPAPSIDEGPEALVNSDQARPYSELQQKLGTVAWFATDFDQAREAYENALAASPSSMAAHDAYFGFANANSDQLDRALQFYHQSLDGSLKWWFAGQLHVARGNKSYNSSDPAGALFHYNAALGALEASASLESDYRADADAQTQVIEGYRAWAYLNLESYQKAEEAFLKTLQREPQSPSARSGLDQLGGRLFAASESGEIGLGEVRNYFDRITDVVEDNADWWNNLGFFARDTSEYEISYEAYRRAAELAPENPRIQNDCALILIYHLKRKLEEAEERCQTAIRVGKKLYAEAESEAGRDDAFLAYTDAQLNVARLCYDQGRLEECEVWLEELLHEHPGRPDAMMLMARLEKKLSEKAEG